MPFIRSLVSEYRAYIVILILLLGAIMPICSYYTKKKLVYVVIIALFNYQPSSYSKCMKLNICFSYNVKSVSDAKCTFFIYFTSY